MANSIQSIALDKLIPHPDNPNRQSRANFAKLVRNIELSGRYEPLVVRPSPQKQGFFQIINGEHRCRALAQLGYRKADAVIWDIDDEQADILLATLNRLGGSDELAKKLALLRRLNKRMASAELAKMLPQTKKQIDRLTNLYVRRRASNISTGHLLAGHQASVFANPLVFFVNDKQQQAIESALSLAVKGGGRGVRGEGQAMSKAARRAAALTYIAEHFLNHSKLKSRT